MVRRIVVSVVALVALLLVSMPAWAQGNPNAQPIFTYVSLWGVPRAQWGDMAKVDAEVKAAVLDPLVANGTLLGHGAFVNLVHSDGGYTHGEWFQATSIAGLLKTNETLSTQPFATAPVRAASKHLDYLMISTIHGSRAVTNSTGYLRVISAQIQSGKMDDFLEAYRRYIVPVYEKLLAEGTIVNYQLDTEYNIENAPGRIFSVVDTRDAEGMDKVRAAVGEVFEKNPAAAEALGSASVPNSRNDLLARITTMTHR
jgi:hypothetical protein